MNVWLFTNADGLSALTIDGEGTNLPGELGPRTKGRQVQLTTDAPVKQEAMSFIREHGFCCFD